MKRRVKGSSAILCIALTLIFSPMTIFSSATENTPVGEAVFDLEAESFDYGEDISKVVIDMQEPVDASSINASTFAVAVKDYPTFDWQTKKVTTTESINRIVTGVTVDGRYVTLEVEHGFGLPGASTLLYDGVAWKNIPIDLKYEVTQTTEIKRTDGSTVAIKDKTYTQNGIYNKLVDRFDKYVDASGISFALYEPKIEEGKKYPLIVWLHGAGEGGYDNKVQIRGNKVVGLIDDDVQSLFANGGAFVLAPQCPTGWMEDKDNNRRSDYLESVIALIENTIKEEKINPEKVYIGGCSMGGYMTWNVILTRPDLFAASFPVCPAYLPTIDELQLVVDLPIWVVHSADDTTVNPAQYSRLTVPALEGIGGNVRYTEFEKTEYNGHWSWQYVFDNFYSDEYGETIMQWLSAQDRMLNTQNAADELSTAPSPAPVLTSSSPTSAVPANTEEALPTADAKGTGMDSSSMVMIALLAAFVLSATLIRIIRNLSKAEKKASESTPLKTKTPEIGKKSVKKYKKKKK